MGKLKNKMYLPFRNDNIYNDLEMKMKDNFIIENKKENISFYELKKIVDKIDSILETIDDQIMSEKNMKQKFRIIGKKQAYSECFQDLSDLLYRSE